VLTESSQVGSVSPEKELPNIALHRRSERRSDAQSFRHGANLRKRLPFSHPPKCRLSDIPYPMFCGRRLRISCRTCERSQNHADSQPLLLAATIDEKNDGLRL